ncbi:MAG TPA: CPBP family intramembrane glutamic endopeptidase, partial [Anaerolineales bacterium]|nr:CPBP family intramembrane glutamic endopeptidase [Anaerolineales bacterium]
MTKKKTFIQKYAVWLYFVLTFAITWGSMALLAGPEGFPFTEAKLEAMGPMVYMGMLVGPSLTALLLTGLESGRTGFRELRRQLFKVRVGLRWYVLALLATPLLALGVLLTLSLFSPEFVPGIFTTEDSTTLLLTGIGVGVFVGIFEELGWIGFVVPRMRQRRSVLATGIIVGVLWGAWHFPPFWEGNTFSGAAPFFLLLIRLFAWLPPYRVLMVWVYDRTGSLFITILMHASLDFSMLVFPSAALSGSHLVTWILVWSAVLWSLVGILSLSESKQATR